MGSPCLPSSVDNAIFFFINDDDPESSSAKQNLQAIFHVLVAVFCAMNMLCAALLDPEIQETQPCKSNFCSSVCCIFLCVVNVCAALFSPEI
jgi:hypothetical protein